MFRIVKRKPVLAKFLFPSCQPENNYSLTAWMSPQPQIEKQTIQFGARSIFK